MLIPWRVSLRPTLPGDRLFLLSLGSMDADASRTTSGLSCKKSMALTAFAVETSHSYSAHRALAMIPIPVTGDEI